MIMEKKNKNNPMARKRNKMAQKDKEGERKGKERKKEWDAEVTLKLRC